MMRLLEGAVEKCAGRLFQCPLHRALHTALDGVDCHRSVRFESSFVYDRLRNLDVRSFDRSRDETDSLGVCRKQKKKKQPTHAQQTTGGRAFIEWLGGH